MLDLGILKLMTLGIVALVVIGPERLPRVARTVGTLIGRAQRYLADVKAEVGREIQLDELRSMRDTVKSAAQSVKQSVEEGLRKTESEVSAAFGMPTSDQMVAAQTAVAPPAPPLPITAEKRSRWRRNVCSRQAATPLWYRQVNRRKSHVQSAAARVSRFRAPGANKGPR
jgi:sec-independent protein translocase protein TatB